MKPETPLPWSVKHLDEGPSEPVACSVIRGDDKDFFKAWCVPEDADYFVHAANAYPKLVELLKVLNVRDYDQEHAIRTLLRGLGEL